MIGIELGTARILQYSINLLIKLEFLIFCFQGFAVYNMTLMFERTGKQNVLSKLSIISNALFR